MSYLLTSSAIGGVGMRGFLKDALVAAGCGPRDVLLSIVSTELLRDLVVGLRDGTSIMRAERMLLLLTGIPGEGTTPSGAPYTEMRDDVMICGSSSSSSGTSVPDLVESVLLRLDAPAAAAATRPPMAAVATAMPVPMAAGIPAPTVLSSPVVSSVVGSPVGVTCSRSLVSMSCVLVASVLVVVAGTGETRRRRAAPGCDLARGLECLGAAASPAV